eukprot:CAMPEP_0197296508 /NCGR_PEP_ID=MMETSP0890-20130614/38506_1 /TAXON_ID=44058 ORGANISM="Aureoumbra lagunensis, Strain CCMP1510" /NCGR_SAMPLE_ID=MMETSP0890 /ASSEMBLY_ACC=CAM_ASM_000533 /LENGTH=299 /DNA_ID=CAMNT_0042773081 /DNA_START=64 /DNA_END=960 /DNA_ORIENTATION=-
MSGEENVPGNGGKRKRSVKVPVMEGQTEEERRALRKKQRAILDRVNDRHAEMIQLDSNAYAEERESNNKLFENVRFTRELGNDGDNLVAIGTVAVERSSQLNQSVAQYPANDIMEKLRERYRGCNGGLWLNLGHDVAGLFKAVPILNFMNGPLEQPQMQKKKAVRRQKQDEDDEFQATQYETMDYGEKNNENVEQRKLEEATNRRLQNLEHVLKTKVAEGEDSVDMMNLLVSPRSFHETVENFFDYSFLVKDGKASIKLDPKTGLPLCALEEQPEDQLKKFQTVVVLGPQDHKRIVDYW